MGEANKARPPLLLSDQKSSWKRRGHSPLSAPTSPRAHSLAHSPLISDVRNCVTPPPTTTARGVVRFFPHAKNDVAAAAPVANRITRSISSPETTTTTRIVSKALVPRGSPQYYNQLQSRSVQGGIIYNMVIGLFFLCSENLDGMISSFRPEPKLGYLSTPTIFTYFHLSLLIFSCIFLF